MVDVADQIGVLLRHAHYHAAQAQTALRPYDAISAALVNAHLATCHALRAAVLVLLGDAYHHHAPHAALYFDRGLRPEPS